jgi:hypothetical protein
MGFNSIIAALIPVKLRIPFPEKILLLNLNVDC